MKRGIRFPYFWTKHLMHIFRGKDTRKLPVLDLAHCRGFYIPCEVLRFIPDV